jgi:hypothetical protein
MTTTLAILLAVAPLGLVGLAIRRDLTLAPAAAPATAAGRDLQNTPESWTN